MSENRGIGKNNRIPWHLSTDQKNFKALTMGHHLIMGRKTYESIGKPLLGRQMVIVTHNQGYTAEGCSVAHSLEDALALTRKRGEDEAFIAGGTNIYAQSLDFADRIYLTLVHAEVESDTFFLEFDKSKWKELETWYHLADGKNEYAFTFKVLERKIAPPKN